MRKFIIRRKKIKRFKPNRSQINQAVKTFLDHGGLISKIHPEDIGNQMDGGLSQMNFGSSTDEFLRGEQHSRLHERIHRSFKKAAE